MSLPYELPAGVKLWGEAVCWNTPHGKVSLKKIRQALADAGLDPKACKPLRIRDAFIRAAKGMQKERLIRLLDRKAGQMVFQLTKETKEEDELVYRKEDLLRLDLTTGKVDADDPATAYEAYLVRLAVKAGDFDALVAGPAPVSLPVDVPTGFFAEFGGDWCDLISSAETDSMPGGNLPLGRHALGRYVTALHHYGVDLKDRWRTGSSGEPIPNGVLHPRRARVRLLHALLWEQHGVPRERNQDAVDRNDGTVWDDRAWWQAEDGTCLPDVALWRTLAMETFGMAYAEPLSFGPIGDAVFLGSVYRGPAGAVVVLVAGSHIDGATVTLNVNTTGTLTVSNAFGATISATVLDGRVTVEVGDVPTYVRIPAAATVSVYRCNDWPPAAQALAWVSQSNRATAVVSGVPAQTAANGGWMTSYNDGAGAYREDRPVPALLFDSDRTGNFEIYSTIAGKVTRLTSDPTYDSWWPRCSPDGTKVLFTRTPAGVHDTDYTQISTWVCNMDGSGLVNILPLGVGGWALQGHPSWSPDGSKIVTMGGAVDLYTCNPDGSGRALLTTTGQSFGLADPAYSPDGTKILYVYGGQVYWVPAAGGTPTAVTANAWTNYDPVLSPDGTTVAYLSHMSANPVADWAVRLIDLAGTNDRACIADGAINSRPEWSADGERIFFHRNPPANGESGVFSLYAINPDGSGLAPVFTGPTGTAEYPVIVHPVDGEPFANITLTFPSTIRCDRVIVWAGPAHATWSTLLDFDVQISVDHAATWTTKATFTSSPTSIAHGSDDTGFGTTRETWWDEQWIFDVPFPAGPVDCNALRLNIRQVSYGGEPDLECLDGIGEGVATRLVTIQEVAVLCDAAASRTPQLV
jgi:Tol biopolymer transport system component